MNNPNRQRRCLSVIGVSLLIAAGAACGSDKKSETTDAPSDATTAVSSEDSRAVSAVETTAVSADSEISVAAATASDDREAIVEFLQNLAAAGNASFDEECLVRLIAQLSDEDAALAADSARAGGEDDTPLSPEGEAIADQLATCGSIDTATTTG